MRISSAMIGMILCCVSSQVGAHGAKPYLGLKGQLYFEDEPAQTVRPGAVPRHVPSHYVARAPVDFSYPESAAAGGISAKADAGPPFRPESGWGLELGQGAKLKFVYDEDTKLSVGMGMWRVKLGVSKSFGGPSREQQEETSRPRRHTSAAGMGRIETAAHR